MGNRFEVYAGRSDDRDVTIFGTVHNRKDLLVLVFQAVKAGYDWVSYINY